MRALTESLELRMVDSVCRIRHDRWEDRDVLEETVRDLVVSVVADVIDAYMRVTPSADPSHHLVGHTLRNLRRKAKI